MIQGLLFVPDTVFDSHNSMILVELPETTASVRTLPGCSQRTRAAAYYPMHCGRSCPPSRRANAPGDAPIRSDKPVTR